MAIRINYPLLQGIEQAAPAQSGFGDHVTEAIVCFRHPELGISYRPPDGFHVDPRDASAPERLVSAPELLVSFRNRIENANGFIYLHHFPDTRRGRTRLKEFSNLRGRGWVVLDEELISPPGGGLFRESCQRIPTIGLVRRIEFWLPAKLGFVHFTGMVHGDRRELRNAVLESVRTLRVG